MSGSDFLMEAIRANHARMARAADMLDAIRVAIGTGELSPETIDGALLGLWDHLAYLVEAAESYDDQLSMDCVIDFRAGNAAG